MAPASVHHTGLVVGDLDRAIGFYERFFSAKVELRAHAHGEEVARLHGLTEADFELAILALESGRLELFEFAVPADGTVVDARACDVGGGHVALQVEDIQAMYSTLVEHGIAFTRPPFSLGDGDAGGHWVAFFRDLDGNRVELVQVG